MRNASCSAAHEGGAHPGPALQRPDGRLAVVAKELDHFVEDPGLVFLAGPGIPIPLFGQHFLSRQFTHLGVHDSVTPF
jgi:hypothetical protein